MAFIKPFGGTIRDTFFEFFIIVIGVLVALGVDAWWQEREAREELRTHLTAIVGEIDQNLFSARNIRENALPAKIKRLGEVLEILEAGDTGGMGDEAFLELLAESSGSMQLWFTQHRYDAVGSADGFRYLQNPELEAYISSMYSAPGILLKQADVVRGDYERRVSHLLPASLASSTHHLRWYTSGEEPAPEVADPLAPSAAVQAIMEERHQLAEMARNEVRYATGTWYALWRVQASCEAARKRILDHPLMQNAVIKPVID